MAFNVFFTFGRVSTRYVEIKKATSYRWVESVSLFFFSLVLLHHKVRRENEAQLQKIQMILKISIGSRRIPSTRRCGCDLNMQNKNGGTIVWIGHSGRQILWVLQTRNMAFLEHRKMSAKKKKLALKEKSVNLKWKFSCIQKASTQIE